MTRVRVCVDAGSWQPGNGIGRYLGSLLPRLIAARPDCEWVLYARGAAASLAPSAAVRIRNDRLPAGIGRVASLATSQPWWLWRDRPDLLWAPAHRLPICIPAATAAVVTIHDLCWLRVPETMRPATRWLDRVLMPPALRRADRIIAISHATRQDLETTFPDTRGKVATVHEAAATFGQGSGPDALATHGIERPFVLFVGTLEPRKNFARLLEAFARSRPGVDLVVAGGAGWRHEAPTAAARRLGVADRVRVLGQVTDALLATLYRHARFLALPSLYEGFGLPLLEALSHGTPVLYGDNSAMPEVAGDAGLGVDALSVESIAAGLSRMLEDDVLRDGLAARAREQAARFSWERAARETLAVFDSALEARRLQGRPA